jgi:hypothetical protein
MFAGLTQGRKPGNTGAVAVMKMKREAKGDEKVAPEKRVYLYVEAEARTTSAKIPKGTFWYSKVCDFYFFFPTRLRGGQGLTRCRIGVWGGSSIWRRRACRSPMSTTKGIVRRNGYASSMWRVDEC